MTGLKPKIAACLSGGQTLEKGAQKSITDVFLDRPLEQLRIL